MACVQVLNVRYLNAIPCAAADRFRFSIRMECTSQLEAKEVEWTMTYVGSALSDSYDQLLDTVEVETVMATMEFEFDAPCPNLFLVPREDQLDNSAVILSAKYKGREFCRVGYYMRHEYTPEFVNSLRGVNADGSPDITEPELPCGEKLNMQFLQRIVDNDNPRVTHYLIDWDAPNDQLVPPLASAEECPDDELFEDDEDDDVDEDEEEEEGEGDMEMDMDETAAKHSPSTAINEVPNTTMTYE